MKNYTLHQKCIYVLPKIIYVSNSTNKTKLNIQLTFGKFFSEKYTRLYEYMFDIQFCLELLEFKSIS